MVDEAGRPWIAAAYLVDDPSFIGTQHGVAEGGASLCDIPADSLIVVRNPFWGHRDEDCPICAARLQEITERTFGST